MGEMWILLFWGSKYFSKVLFGTNSSTWRCWNEISLIFNNQWGSLVMTADSYCSGRREKTLNGLTRTKTEVGFLWWKRPVFNFALVFAFTAAMLWNKRTKSEHLTKLPAAARVINLQTLTCCNLSPELRQRGRRRRRLCSTSSCFAVSEKKKSISKVNFPCQPLFSFSSSSAFVTLALLESRQTQHDVEADQCVNDCAPYLEPL